jgi:large subunit ribosomal protein L1
MAKLSKNRKANLEAYDADKEYSLEEAAGIIKKIAGTTKFDSSVDLAVRLGVDPRKANEMVRGIVTLPHGTGKDVKVLVLCTPDKEAEAKEAGADHAGLDEYIQKIKDGWTDVDVIITMPSVMGKVGALGRILGPRGLMPNPKLEQLQWKLVKQ